MRRTQVSIPRNAPEVVVSGIKLKGLPCAVVFLNDPNKAGRKFFAKCCHALSVGWEQLDDDGAYMVSGGFDNLDALFSRHIIRDWHWTTNASVSRGTGDGEKKPRPRSNKFDAPPDANKKLGEMRKAEEKFRDLHDYHVARAAKKAAEGK